MDNELRASRNDRLTILSGFRNVQRINGAQMKQEQFLVPLGYYSALLERGHDLPCIQIRNSHSRPCQG
jgi:hypothetical protein